MLSHRKHSTKHLLLNKRIKDAQQVLTWETERMSFHWLGWIRLCRYYPKLSCPNITLLWNNTGLKYFWICPSPDESVYERYGSLSMIFNKASIASVETSRLCFWSRWDGATIVLNQCSPSIEKPGARIILIYEVELNFVKLQPQPYFIDDICHLKELLPQSTL